MMDDAYAQWRHLERDANTKLLEYVLFNIKLHANCQNFKNKMRS